MNRNQKNILAGANLLVFCMVLSAFIDSKELLFLSAIGFVIVFIRMMFRRMEKVGVIMFCVSILIFAIANKVIEDPSSQLSEIQSPKQPKFDRICKWEGDSESRHYVYATDQTDHQKLRAFADDFYSQNETVYVYFYEEITDVPKYLCDAKHSDFIYKMITEVSKPVAVYASTPMQGGSIIL